MLPDLFHLSAIWLALSLVGLLAFGARSRSSEFLSSTSYIWAIIVVGDVIAVAALHQSLSLVAGASAALALLGIVFTARLADWNAPGRGFFLFSVAASLLYLAYAFGVTALGPASPFGFLYSFLLLLLEAAVLAISLSYAFEVLDFLC